MSAIELADFPTLTRAARRTRLVGVVVVALALGLAAAAFFAAPSRPATPVALLPHGAQGIVVVDVSASISWDTYAGIAATLDRLRRGGGTAGLVFFSDTAYQALPPATPVGELQPFQRFFQVARPSEPGLLPQPPRSPWTDSFSAGTRISAGLELALDVVRQERLRRPVVLLVSDLDDDAGDLESLTSVALAYRRLGIPIRVVGLNPSVEDARFVGRLLPQGGRVVDAALPAPRQAEPSAGLPRALMLIAAAFACVLALHLFLTERLRWGQL
jgi:hypothetical protein